MSTPPHSALPVDVQSAERLAGAFIETGMARMPARVLAAAMVDDDGRMTAAELAEFLDVSAASVSGAVRMLAQIGFLRRERERGTRRDVYVVDDDAWHDAMLRYDQVYAPIKAAMDAARQQLGADHPATRRLTLSLEFLTFIEHEMKAVVDRWDARKRELGLDR
ncbi:DNA-binding transcriptional regulator GbsR (MarR family) [Nocardioides thalensis]|uniref:DNA-binding transcriptional regulator GbsR (MarR family) n=1 Tax=Nocardioides thalensis TaxID=1914755 RepID=A0A853C120_9ACTN|nr:MarR family transcriptional regulator [Nocardioides thalensis]NYJ01285.1 DNA-binding transcriptional regulator GbsR (MarR family) [Nocardioides thalensis]